MKLNFYEETQLGGRHNNQDYYAHVIEEKWACFIVADGLGGHAKGEVASRVFCVNAMEQVKHFANDLALNPLSAMNQLVEATHHAMQKQIKQEYGFIDTHTTFAMAWFNDAHLITAHVGDSRVYRLDASGVLWRTPDHTLVQSLLEEGKVTEEDFSTHPLQNRLLRTVHLFDSPDPDIFLQAPLAEHETLLLCTDGFWTHITKPEFIQIATTADLNQTVDTLVAKILREHPKDADNVTVQVVKTDIVVPAKAGTQEL